MDCTNFLGFCLLDMKIRHTLVLCSEIPVLVVVVVAGAVVVAGPVVVVGSKVVVGAVLAKIWPKNYINDIFSIRIYVHYIICICM